MIDDAYERGLAIRDEMLGSEHGRAKVEAADDFTRDFEVLVTRFCSDRSGTAHSCPATPEAC